MKISNPVYKIHENFKPRVPHLSVRYSGHEIKIQFKDTFENFTKIASTKNNQLYDTGNEYCIERTFGGGLKLAIWWSITTCKVPN